MWRQNAGRWSETPPERVIYQSVIIAELWERRNFHRTSSVR
jgi:hypothetical protein